MFTHAVMVLGPLTFSRSDYMRVTSFQYSSLVHLCTDVMESVCAPRRIQSMLIAANEVLPGNSVIEQVVSWTKAVSAAISRLKEDFKEFPDVVEPFVMALDQVCLCNATHLTVTSSLYCAADTNVCV